MLALMPWCRCHKANPMNLLLDSSFGQIWIMQGQLRVVGGTSAVAVCGHHANYSDQLPSAAGDRG